jgi:hypothetical protein
MPPQRDCINHWRQFPLIVSPGGPGSFIPREPSLEGVISNLLPYLSSFFICVSFSAYFVAFRLSYLKNRNIRNCYVMELSKCIYVSSCVLQQLTNNHNLIAIYWFVRRCFNTVMFGLALCTVITTRDFPVLMEVP